MTSQPAAGARGRIGIPLALLAALALAACSDSKSLAPTTTGSDASAHASADSAAKTDSTKSDSTTKTDSTKTDSTKTDSTTRTDTTAKGDSSSSKVDLPPSGPWMRIVEGRTGPASRYAVYVPTSWNNAIVYIAHGFRDVAMPVGLQDQDSLYALRDSLGARGFAVAYSSFDANGFAVKDGVIRMHQLRGLGASVLPSAPTRSYLVGYSLGAGIDLKLAEQYPSQYSGALLMCGMVGGSQVQTQYVAHVRALFDYFYPGQLPGGMFSMPPGTTYTPEQIAAIVQSNPAGLYAIASTAQTPLPYLPLGDVTDPSSYAAQTLIGSLTYALAWHARGIEDAMALTHGHIPFDNHATHYVLGTPVIDASVVTPLIAAADSGVARFTADRSAWNYFKHNFTPTGRLSFPVLTVHSVYDNGVPIFHEDSLLAAVTAAGATNFLVQRRLSDQTLANYGHCSFTSAQTIQAFVDLTKWVETGEKPTP